MGIASSAVRARAIAAYEAGNGTQAEVALIYGVDISTFQRWLQRHRRTGIVSPLPRGHNPPAVDKEHALWLEALVRESPDAALAQQQERLGVS